jgi:hypothetical protein
MLHQFRLRALLPTLLLCLVGPWLGATQPARARTALASAWQPLAPLPVPSDDIAAVALPDGSVLAVGGDAGVLHGVRLTARYSAITGTWQRLPDAPVPMSTAALATLASGVVLVVEPSFALGGTATPSRALIFSPATGKWRILPSCPVPLLSPRLVSLSASEMLAVGGVGANIGAVLNVTTGQWTVVPSPVPNLATYAIAPLGVGRVLLVAEVAIDGHGTPGAVRRAFAFSAQGSWQELARPIASEDGAQAVALDSGEILLAGGYPVGDNPNLPVPPAQLYRPRTNSWQILSSTGAASRGAQLLALPGGRALLVGGHFPAGNPSSQCLLYRQGRWHSVDNLPGPWSGYALVVLPRGDVMLIGGDRPIGHGFGASNQTLLLSSAALQG